jgi:hypothetical protein
MPRANSLEPVYRLRCQNSSRSNIAFSARPSVAKALQRCWACLGRYNLPGHSCSCCSPPPASRAGTLCAECGSQPLARSQILPAFRQHHVMERFFPLVCPCARRHVCLFWILPTGISSSRLRLIEHGASDAPCLILQADTLHGPALQPGLSTGVYTRHGEPAGKSMITVRCPCMYD